MAIDFLFSEINPIPRLSLALNYAGTKREGAISRLFDCGAKLLDFTFQKINFLSWPKLTFWPFLLSDWIIPYDHSTNFAFQPIALQNRFVEDQQRLQNRSFASADLRGVDFAME